jgi:hypothetical protein
MDDRIRLRRRLHRQQRSGVAAMEPLQFRADAADLDVGVVHVYANPERGIALSLVTAVGVVNVVLPDQLASDMADGVNRLIRQRRLQEAT